MTASFEIVHEDEQLLVINKAADLVCHPTKGDAYSSLVGRIRLYLGEEAEWHLINRLDRETSGLVVVAKDLETARAWRSVWEKREVEKIYDAIVHGVPSPSEGLIDAPIGKAVGSPVVIKNGISPDGASARTRYKVEKVVQRENQPFAWLKVAPESGRKHQIRIHLSHLGHPIVGDKLYGPDEQIYLAFVESRMTDLQRNLLILENHGLHASEIRAEVGGKPWHFHSPLPTRLRDFLEMGTG